MSGSACAAARPEQADTEQTGKKFVTGRAGAGGGDGRLVWYSGGREG